MKFEEVTLDKGCITIAYREIEGPEFDVVKYGIAFCSPADGFNRDKGRLIAGNRLDSVKRTGCVKMPHDADIVGAILHDIETGNYSMSRHRKNESALTPLWFFN